MIKKYTKSPGKYFWTGLRDVGSRGEYSWASVGGVKRSVTFSNWNILEPGVCLSLLSNRNTGTCEIQHIPKYVLHLPLECEGNYDLQV